MDLPDGKLRRTLIDNRDTIQSLRFSRDGRLLAAACSHGHIHLWICARGGSSIGSTESTSRWIPPDADLMVAKEGGKIAFIRAQGREP